MTLTASKSQTYLLCRINASMAHTDTGNFLTEHGSMNLWLTFIVTCAHLKIKDSFPFLILHSAFEITILCIILFPLIKEVSLKKVEVGNASPC